VTASLICRYRRTKSPRVLEDDYLPNNFKKAGTGIRTLLSGVMVMVL
jgi:hypothetical protein